MTNGQYINTSALTPHLFIMSKEDNIGHKRWQKYTNSINNLSKLKSSSSSAHWAKHKGLSTAHTHLLKSGYQQNNSSTWCVLPWKHCSLSCSYSCLIQYFKSSARISDRFPWPSRRFVLLKVSILQLITSLTKSWK